MVGPCRPDWKTARKAIPRNFTRSEWEQAKKSKQDPKALKAMFQECWAKTGSGQAYADALANRGYTLAQGDRRGVVAVDFRGQVYAVAKWTGLRTKETREKLEQLKDLPGLDQAKAMIATRMTETLHGYVEEAEAARREQRKAFAAQRGHLVDRQRKARTDLTAAIEKRWTQETTMRASRLNKGVRGLWDRVTGRHGKQVRQNEHDALAALQRDRREKDALIEKHLEERQAFHMLSRQQKQGHEQDMAQLHRDIAEYAQMGPAERTALHNRSSSRKRNQHEAEKTNGVELSRD